MNRFRIVFPLLCIAVALGVGVLAFNSARPPVSASSTPLNLGGPFQMVDQAGRPADQTRLNGKWSAVFFGYTFCPDACPTALQALAAVQDRLGARAKDFQIVFVTIDPARDTPDKMKTYLDTPGFPKGVLGLTGAPDQVARIAKAYRVYYAKSGTGPDYAMDHSVITYLVDPRGHVVTVLSPNQTPDQLSALIRKQMDGAS
jgi:protein SCO1/2